MSRVACETATCTGFVLITGEITTNAKVDYARIARDTIKEIGYDDSRKGFDGETCAVLVAIDGQSPDIAMGVDKAYEVREQDMTESELSAIGAGDQGMMFGFACDETSDYKPIAMQLLQDFSRFYDELRQQDTRFLPDGKTQITGIYDSNMHLVKIKDWTISYQNTEEDREATDKILMDQARKLAKQYDLEVEKFLVNPTGKFLIGGFQGDAGLTGRKIVVDSYQSFAPVGGGAFSGKDPSKVDRSGAYKAREIAIRYLKEYQLARCEVQLSYAIGVAEPLAIYIVGDGKNIDPKPELYAECTPKQMISDLDLLNKRFEETAKFGHF